MMDFPENYLRGIRKSDWISSDGKVTSYAFEPDSKTASEREDGCSEMSINWEDDTNTIVITLQSYPHGAVRLQTYKIDYVNKMHGSLDALRQERKPLLPKNPYHGNLLFRRGLSKPLMRLMAGSLALGASDVIKPE